MSSPPDVSIVVPVQGDADLAWRCFLALAELPDVPAFEIVIVDDGAPGLAALLERLSGDVVIGRTSGGAGFARAAALGAELASAQTLVFLRGTPLVGPDWLAPLCAALARADVAAAVSAQTGTPDAHAVTSPALAVTRGRLAAAGGIPVAPDAFVLAALAVDLVPFGRTVVAERSTVAPAAAEPLKDRHEPGTAPELSVVIPTLDAASDRMRECLATLAATVEVPYEVVLLDNGSPPQGYTEPVNSGVRAARGRYVVVMNDDVWPLPGWWPPLRTALDSGASVAFPATVGSLNRKDFAAWCFAFRRADIGRFSHAPGELFDPRFVVWYQDTDLLVRLKTAGTPPLLVSESQIRHGLSETVTTADAELRAWIMETVTVDKERFFDKHPSVRTRPVEGAPAITSTVPG